MLHNIYLEGEFGDKFGKEYSLEANNFVDIIKCLDCNFDGEVRKYIIDCHEKDIGFTCKVADDKFLASEEELLISLAPGDVIITPVPAGSKSGGQQVLAAVAIAALLWWNPAALFGAYGTGFGGAFATSINVYGLALAAVGVNLALTGIQQLMAPDPSTDNERETTYLFNGSEQNIVEGDPVPVLYGQLRVPGRPISFEIINEEFRSPSGADNKLT